VLGIGPGLRQRRIGAIVHIVVTTVAIQHVIFGIRPHNRVIAAGP